MPTITMKPHNCIAIIYTMVFAKDDGQMMIRFMCKEAKMDVIRGFEDLLQCHKNRGDSEAFLDTKKGTIVSLLSTITSLSKSYNC